MSLLRTRWAAIGAAVAVTLGAGGIGMVAATSPSEAVTFVPITPCRLFDTRPEFQVGTRSAPLGPGDIHTVEATGSNGDCTGIPSNATAVSMNMTSTDATDPTFLTVWAAGETRPDASSMNPVPGAPAVPNGVISALNGDGEFSVFNLAGSVHVLADINGYYVDHDHDDRYYTKTQTNSALAGKANTGDVYTRAEIDARKFINIDTMRDVEGVQANAPLGGNFSRFDTSLIVPPDYTPGSPMTLRLNILKVDSSPYESCEIDLRQNYTYALRPATATQFSAALLGRTLVTLGATRFDIETVDFTLTGPFAPGDSVSFGVFASGAATTCSPSDTAVQSAAIYYD